MDIKLLKIAGLFVAVISLSFVWCVIYVNDAMEKPYLNIGGLLKFISLWFFGLMTLFALMALIKYSWELL